MCVSIGLKKLHNSDTAAAAVAAVRCAFGRLVRRSILSVLRWRIRPHVCIRYMCRCSECVLYKYSSPFTITVDVWRLSKNDPNTTVIAFPRRKKKKKNKKSNKYLTKPLGNIVSLPAVLNSRYFFCCKYLRDESLQYEGNILWFTYRITSKSSNKFKWYTVMLMHMLKTKMNSIIDRHFRGQFQIIIFYLSQCRLYVAI